jgi:hypothetical protein
MKTLLVITLVATVTAFSIENKLTGRWETRPSSKGSVTGVVFKADNSFEGYVNKKPFVSGIYTFQDSILSFTDNGCDGKQGVYKILFFSNEDSLRFIPINDSCDGRREGMSRLILGRIK